MMLRRAVLLLLAGAGLAGSLRAESARLGRIDFPTSGGAGAQKRFLEGVLLLHSFEYSDSAEAFREAQKLEPGFAMAYWGEAMTKNHPIWNERDSDAAREVLRKLAPTRAERLAKSPTERERAYLEAVEILFEEGSKAERDRAHAEAMRKLYERFPKDLEAASFYALALLGTTQGTRDFPTYMKAAAIAEEVFAENAEHPGAAHYLIHSYDDPIHGPLGLRAARVYARIAPAASHALHMPSHIFLALGMWEDTVSSNEASWDAADARVVRKKLPVDERGFHALFWLEYALLQQGRFREAREELATMEQDTRKSGSERTRRHLGAMRAAYLVETERCDGEVLAMKLEDPSAERDRFVAGFCAWKLGDRAGLERALAKLPADDRPEGTHAHGAHAAPASGSATVAGVLRQELEAMRRFSRGEREEALRLAREAAAAEDSMVFEFGPPDVVKPAHELAGELALAIGRAGEAKAEFEAALARAPGRSRSLLGLARAAEKAGDAAAAREASRRLKDNLKRADREIPGYVELGDLSDRK
jgi:tetratricopeptide (TPR) repeat protein